MATIHHVSTNDPEDPLMSFKESDLKIRQNVPFQKLTVSKNFGKVILPFRMIISGASGSG